jgi:hypothetical protein
MTSYRYPFNRFGVLAVVEDLYQRITKVETRLDEHDRKLQQQEVKNDTLIELKTILQMQVDASKKQVDQMEKFDKTLSRIDKNLDGLNMKFETIDKRVEKLEINDESSKVHVPSLGVKILVGICMIIPTLITAWLLIQLNLK